MVKRISATNANQPQQTPRKPVKKPGRPAEAFMQGGVGQAGGHGDRTMVGVRQQSSPIPYRYSQSLGHGPGWSYQPDRFQWSMPENTFLGGNQGIMGANIPTPQPPQQTVGGPSPQPQAMGPPLPPGGMGPPSIDTALRQMMSGAPQQQMQTVGGPSPQPQRQTMERASDILPAMLPQRPPNPRDALSVKARAHRATDWLKAPYIDLMQAMGKDPLGQEPSYYKMWNAMDNPQSLPGVVPVPELPSPSEVLGIPQSIMPQDVAGAMGGIMQGIGNMASSAWDGIGNMASSAWDAIQPRPPTQAQARARLWNDNSPGMMGEMRQGLGPAGALVPDHPGKKIELPGFGQLRYNRDMPDYPSGSSVPGLGLPRGLNDEVIGSAPNTMAAIERNRQLGLSPPQPEPAAPAGPAAGEPSIMQPSADQIRDAMHAGSRRGFSGPRLPISDEEREAGLAAFRGRVPQPQPQQSTQAVQTGSPVAQTTDPWLGGNKPMSDEELSGGGRSMHYGTASKAAAREMINKKREEIGLDPLTGDLMSNRVYSKGLTPSAQDLDRREKRKAQLEENRVKAGRLPMEERQRLIRERGLAKGDARRDRMRKRAGDFTAAEREAMAMDNLMRTNPAGAAAIMDARNRSPENIMRLQENEARIAAQKAATETAAAEDAAKDPNEVPDRAPGEPLYGGAGAGIGERIGGEVDALMEAGKTPQEIFAELTKVDPRTGKPRYTEAQVRSWLDPGGHMYLTDAERKRGKYMEPVLPKKSMFSSPMHFIRGLWDIRSGPAGSSGSPYFSGRK